MAKCNGFDERRCEIFVVLYVGISVCGICDMFYDFCTVCCWMTHAWIPHFTFKICWPRARVINWCNERGCWQYWQLLWHHQQSAVGLMLLVIKMLPDESISPDPVRYLYWCVCVRVWVRVHACVCVASFLVGPFLGLNTDIGPTALMGTKDSNVTIFFSFTFPLGWEGWSELRFG